VTDKGKTPLVFSQGKQKKELEGHWDILIIDDDDSVHVITKMALKNLAFEEKGLRFHDAFSATEARKLLAEIKQPALILLDVVMEDEDAGLKLVPYIREELGNKMTRIILRTGQPGQAPPKKIIAEYDINDYKEKTELTEDKLYTTVMASLRNYRDLRIIEEDKKIIEKNRRGLEKIIHSSAHIFEIHSLKEFAEGTLTQLQSLLQLEDDVVYMQLHGFSAIEKKEDCVILAGTGRFHDLTNKKISEVLDKDAVAEILHALKDKKSVHQGNTYIGYYESDSSKERYILYTHGVKPLTGDERQLIDIFSSNISIAFDNITLHEDILNTQAEIVTTLGDIIETRFSETANHVRRVADLSGFLARKIGISDQDTRILKFASTLHDVGKIGIPDKILLKPSKLSEAEYEAIKEHTELGFKILQKSEKSILQAAAIVSHQHHECWDGSGYPGGLKGEEIHIFSRIVSIADVFDALSHNRIYKSAMPFEEVLEYLKEQRGIAFDPELIDIFMENIEEINEIMQGNP
jgi:response regulator RpfG family c-di-GMP phosphodiesterase